MAAREDGGAAGVLLLDKPSGPTSHDAVDRARAALGTRRIGHTGTLDPFASGLLILCAGAATRLAEYFQRPGKRYEAVLRLGVETASHDPEGEVVETSDRWREVEEADLRRALAELTGRIRQTPPAYSAKRVGGERAYRAARAGRDVELEAETVEVHELRLDAFEPPEARVACRVSTGTYVRSLARDVGRALGCGAHLRALRRTAVGPFRAERALAWSELVPDGWREAAGGEDGAWIAPARALPWLPVRRLAAEEARRVRHGGRVPRREVDPPRRPLDAPPDGSLPVLLVRDGRLLAVAEAMDGELQPRKVWPDAA